MDRAEELWSKCRVLLNIPSGTLLWQSPNFPFRRVYVANNIVCKVVDLKCDASGSLREQDFAGEFSILKHCAGIPGVPSVIVHHKTDEFEVIVMNRFPGEPLSNLTIGWFRLFIILAKLGIILLRLSWRGISHNDILPQNVLVTSSGSVSLIDFDQAIRTKFLIAFIRQFTGINIGGGKVHGSLISIFKRYVKKRLSPRAIQFLRKLRAHMTRKKLHPLPVLPNGASSQLKTLSHAWKIAQDSDANAPGQHLAYYSLSLEGYYFPGERPWIDRWNMLRSITDYSGKRILELGCNMGLLSTFLLKDSDASSALAVDNDDKILDAVKLISMAFGVKPLLKVQDLDSPEDWETKLSDFKPDIVFTLNVLNWVQDKKRLLNFLGRFREVIFEGHDNLDIESKRLSDVGFKRINIVGISERGREVLHCRK